jgi:hypothetical protein
MSVQVQGELVLSATLALYIIVPTVLCLRGWIIRAGLGMLALSVMPMIWQVIAVPDSDAPGSGMLALLLLPLAVIVILVGIANLIYRGVSAFWRRASS